MAREAYRSLYGALTKLKDDSLLKDPAAGAGDDNEMFQLLLAVSDWVDHFCNRYFYSKTQTMEFDGTGSTRLLIPDLVSLTSLKEDSTDDQSFNETWAAYPSPAAWRQDHIQQWGAAIPDRRCLGLSSI